MCGHSASKLFFIFVILSGCSVIQGQERCKDEKNEHLCRTDGVCISKVFQCDGLIDCSDGSDETTDICQHRLCSETSEFSETRGDAIQIVESRTYRCKYGACISQQYVCDGVVNCRDRSDETHEQCNTKICKSTEFQCAYGACIPLSYVCNGLVNCHDGSDEMKTGCETIRSCDSRFKFKCDYGACIRKTQVCNGIANCRDESDETEAECGAGHKYRPHKVPFGNPIDTALATLPPVDTPLPPAVADQDGCSRQTIPPGVKTEILICGGESCRSLITVPTGTLVLALCSVDGIVLECRNDKLWYPVETTSLPTTRICEAPKIVKPDLPTGCKYNSFRQTTVQILKCGINFPVSECEGNVQAPPGTIVASHCGDTQPKILQCFEDKQWHTLSDAGVQSNIAGSCSISSPVSTRSFEDCGHASTLKGELVGFRWPWLVGLFLNGNYICTGTFISSSIVITAGHCLVKNQAANRDVISAEDLKIQHYQRGRIIQSPVVSIQVHPQYIGGSRPKYDLGLVKLARSVIIPGEFQPACLDIEGKFLGKMAFVFNRTIGQTDYSWSPFTQSLDVSCFNRNTPCSRHLSIGPEQFCGTNLESDNYLYGGSSGGPYLIQLGRPGQERWHVAGIVSHSIDTVDSAGLCQKPHTVFSSVSILHSWIMKCVTKSDCN